MYPYQQEQMQRAKAYIASFSPTPLGGNRLKELSSIDQIDEEAEREGVFLSGTLTRSAFCPIRRHFMKG